MFSIYRDLPPSQGGKYAGFGNTVDPPPRSYSTNDFYDSSVGGLTKVRKLYIRVTLNSVILSQPVKLNLNKKFFPKQKTLQAFNIDA